MGHMRVPIPQFFSPSLHPPLLFPVLSFPSRSSLSCTLPTLDLLIFFRQASETPQLFGEATSLACLVNGGITIIPGSGVP